MKVFLLLFSFFILPAQAFAYGCDCGSIGVMLTRVQTETIQAVNANTTAEAENMRSQIMLAAQNIIGTIKTENATLVRAIVSLKENNAAMLKGQAVAGEVMRSDDLYGKAAQPAGLCGASSLGAGVQLGAQAAQQVQQSMRDKQLEYANRADAMPVLYLKRVLDESHPTEQQMADAFFPVKGTLTDEQLSQAHETIKTLANPRPLPMVTAEQESSPSGQPYAVARKIHEGRITLAMNSLNSHVVFHAPTLTPYVTSWAKAQWEEAGGSGEVPGMVSGKMSEAGLFKLLSQMRIGNPNWFNQITGASEAGLLREMVMMQAMQLELARKNNELLDQISAVTALDYLTSLEATAGKEMEDLYIRMVGAQQ